MIQVIEQKGVKTPCEGNKKQSRDEKEMIGKTENKGENNQ